MDKEKLFSISNQIEFSTWIIAIILGIIGVYSHSNILLKITAGIFIFKPVHAIVSHMYFKKAVVLRGVSANSKFQIEGTIFESAVCLYFAYFILTHIK